MMRRRFLLTLPVAAGALPARAQSQRWERIAGPHGRYSLEMPGPVRHRSSSRPDAGTLRQWLFEWEGNALDFAVYDIVQANPDHPPTDLAAQLADAQRAVHQRWPGSTILQQGEVQLGPAQGRAFVLSLDGGKRILTARVYYDNERLYEQMALTTPQEQNGPVLTRFMDSLSIVS